MNVGVITLDNEQAAKELIAKLGKLEIVDVSECERHHNMEMYGRSILPIKKVCEECYGVIK